MLAEVVDALLRIFMQIKSPTAIAIDPVAVNTFAAELAAMVKTSAVSTPFFRNVKTSEPVDGCVLVVLTRISVMVIACSADIVTALSVPLFALDCIV